MAQGQMASQGIPVPVVMSWVSLFREVAVIALYANLRSETRHNPTCGSQPGLLLLGFQPVRQSFNVVLGRLHSNCLLKSFTGARQTRDHMPASKAIRGSAVDCADFSTART